LELRPTVPLAKGDEIVIHRTFPLEPLAERRAQIKGLGFEDCTCEICTVPDSDLSKRFEAKLVIAKETIIFFDSLVAGKNTDFVRAAHLLKDFISFVTEDRVFTPDYLVKPMELFAIVGRPALFLQVANATMAMLKRYYGTSFLAGQRDLETFSFYLETPQAHPLWNLCPVRKGRKAGQKQIDDLLRKIATDIVSIFENFP
jgi:hypothetical protein